ncbi:MAG: peptide-methionine (S)-S-oxide reductase MsrA [Acetobacteraceae bacterium]|nr:peptide-methionine (S)-S-oxide reductase MsrA [Acetobacteraceae bacterium]
MSASTETKGELATLGGGCFWCLDAVFRNLKGVESVVSGYAGGHVPNPSYEQVCTGRTGHAEVVQIRFDPDIMSYADLLRIFFAVHDPTTPNRQGNDIGPQYRSIILTHSEEQRRIAEAIIAETAAAGVWDGSIITEVVPLQAFYPAEAYHQNYFAHHPEAGYCRVVIAPKLAKFRKNFAARLHAEPIP